MPKARDYEPMTAEQLKRRRARLGLTQEELAATLRIATKTLQHYEQAQKIIPDWFANALKMHMRILKLEDSAGESV